MMIVTETLSLDPSDEDFQKLMIRVRLFNDACGWLSGIAFQEKLWHWLPLQRRAYRDLRNRFGLRSVEAVVCVRKVAYAYRDKTRRRKQARFRPLGSIPLCKHAYKRDGTVRFYGFRIPFRARPDVAVSSKCEAKLVLGDSKFLIRQAIEIPEPERMRPQDHLGVDLGIANLAVDSDGTCHPRERHPFTPGQVRGFRRRQARLRGKLQGIGTRSAKRRLQRRRRKERRFASHVNHAIAKDLVAQAKGTGRGIALEDLKGIRARIKARKAQRRDLHSWSFAQLRAYIEYKALKEGVAVVFTDPKNTSVTCPRPECGYVDKRNRPERSRFRCVRCGFAGPADAIAAENIRRAAGSRPDAAA
jgi:IS605 OrfB family transposase